ncbi:DNA-binding MarR family transcriptional regulator [Salirhabdus euzebyi]|uniref:DNA-binding MarR family transcriptional regulator n=1 Tax=Salirhabdus euzebyi TaxID=394506 RepID=A0A841Q4D0_9BACI|nr:MarR family transcriptional regulator [Salirhabdus euzebyi]MBB6453254.1 DNA-binding MarR family transcriptional regulator [Salirhabdus euzebyi]
MSKDDQFTNYIKEAFSLLEKINAQVVKDHQTFMNNDLTPKQLFILQTIRDEKKVTINQLSERTMLSASSVSQIIARLEKDRYVRRDINPENRREIIVKLDKKGLELFKEYEKIDDKIIEQYYGNFSLQEVKTFRDLVKKLHDEMKSESSRKES